MGSFLIGKLKFVIESNSKIISFQSIKEVPDDFF